MNAPLVISASRRTDIPAFYADWFMSRIEVGFCEYINPFNQKPVRVDLSKVKFIVFWTKNPVHMFKHLPTLDKKGIKYYFQYTLNDYEGYGIERGLYCLDDRISHFRTLSKMIGKEKVIFRFDPLILVDNMSVNDLMERVFGVAEKVHDVTEKMVFSFADLGYQKVQFNLAKNRNKVREFSLDAMHYIGYELGKYGKQRGIKVATCSEAVNLVPYGVEHNCCVDPELIMRLTDHDEEIAKYLSAPSGQRPLCSCARSVDIGMYDTCLHGCAYCYATRSFDVARTNFEKHLSNPYNSSII